MALSRREIDVAELLVQGLRNKQIAAELCISSKTVENHIRTMLKKTESRNRTELAVWHLKNKGVN